MKRRKLLITLTVTVLASFIYSIFLPLKLGTLWFYGGFFVCLLGMACTITALINFETTPVDKPVTKGVYRISRNPQFLGVFLVFIGAGIACASWLFLLLTMTMIISYDISVVAEERFLLEKYGNAYKEYMNRTPKWTGIPKSRKSIRKK